MTSSAAIYHCRAPAKVNLRLEVVGRRPDGYHLLDSDVVPIGLYDRLSVCVTSAPVASVTLVCNLSAWPADTDLTVQAAHLFMRRAGVTLRVAIRLWKRIPVGAGLGGGSSDAGATLLCLNRSVPARVEQEALTDWSLELGADVPFFMTGRPARVRGIGEKIDPLPLANHPSLVVAFPGHGLSTADVYRGFDDSLTNYRAKSTIRPSALGNLPLADSLWNDLEPAATRILPELESLKRRLRELGALGTLMTGSGSAVFGIWSEKTRARVAARKLNREGIWAKAVDVLERSPSPWRDDGRSPSW